MGRLFGTIPKVGRGEHGGSAPHARMDGHARMLQCCAQRQQPRQLASSADVKSCVGSSLSNAPFAVRLSCATRHPPRRC